MRFGCSSRTATPSIRWWWTRPGPAAGVDGFRWRGERRFRLLRLGERDTAVIGAPAARIACQGAAYVFVRSGGAWTQQQELTASDGAASDRFGYSVSVSGDTAVIGAVGKNGAPGSRVRVCAQRRGVDASSRSWRPPMARRGRRIRLLRVGERGDGGDRGLRREQLPRSRRRGEGARRDPRGEHQGAVSRLLRAAPSPAAVGAVRTGAVRDDRRVSEPRRCCGRANCCSSTTCSKDRACCG